MKARSFKPSALALAGVFALLLAGLSLSIGDNGGVVTVQAHARGGGAGSGGGSASGGGGGTGAMAAPAPPETLFVAPIPTHPPAAALPLPRERPPELAPRKAKVGAPPGDNSAAKSGEEPGPASALQSDTKDIKSDAAHPAPPPVPVAPVTAPASVPLYD